MHADLMLAWMSETGTGDVRIFGSAWHGWRETLNMNPQPFETGRWLRDMSALAHVESTGLVHGGQ